MPSPDTTTPTAPRDLIELDLDVQGMTCGACAARVQRILGRQDGVDLAEVNFATGRAHVAMSAPVPTGRPAGRGREDRLRRHRAHA